MDFFVFKVPNERSPVSDVCVCCCISRFKFSLAVSFVRVLYANPHFLASQTFVSIWFPSHHISRQSDKLSHHMFVYIPFSATSHFTKKSTLPHHISTDRAHLLCNCKCRRDSPPTHRQTLSLSSASSSLATTASLSLRASTVALAGEHVRSLGVPVGV